MFLRAIFYHRCPEQNHAVGVLFWWSTTCNVFCQSSKKVDYKLPMISHFSVLFQFLLQEHFSIFFGILGLRYLRTKPFLNRCKLVSPGAYLGGGIVPWPALWVARIVKLHRKVSKIEAWPSPLEVVHKV